MPKYLFTSDQRISELPARIQWVARYIQEGNDTTQIRDKSENNNASTLKFYYNLHKGTEICAQSAENPFFAIRNFVKKFQFPNARTPESLTDSINENVFLAPYRSVITILHLMAKGTGTSSISISEILYFVFGNPKVYGNPLCDYNEVIQELWEARNSKKNLDEEIPKLIQWKQYERQARELITVITYASKRFRLSNSILFYDTNPLFYQPDDEFINEILSYNKFWYPSNYSDYKLSNLEYISYMDTKNTPYSVIDFKLRDSHSRTGNLHPLQQIFYGAPGTGKSHTINEITEQQPKENVFRTTFHPDSDYSTFVGCYKPTTEVITSVSLHKLHELYPEFKGKVGNRPLQRFITKYYNSFRLLTEKEAESVFDKIETPATVTAEVPKIMAAIDEIPSSSSISYSFVPQSFTKAYLRAWQTTEPVYLVIEEINRGNCAQIFGDLFQLLDRKCDGFSEYPIKADNDLAAYLAEKLSDSPRTDIPELVKSGEELVLPSNLYIWATMNTSDQSLFPIDSAFKRRWDWTYIPIDTTKESWNINADGVNYDWSNFLEKINAKIESATSSEDKMLGFYFCKAENGTITAERFVNKVIFYLWNDVFKDYGLEDSIFNDENNEKLTFKKFYQANGNVDECKVQLFLQNLQVQEKSNPIVSDIDEEKSTGISDKQARFWTGFNQARENNAEYSQIYTKRTPAAEAWMDLSFGNSTYHPTLSVIFTKKLIRAGIWIGPSERSQEIFNHFKENETAINEIVGEQMDFSINKSSYLIKIEKTWNLDDESTWPSAYEWFMSMAIKMNDIKEKFGH